MASKPKVKLTLEKVIDKKSVEEGYRLLQEFTSELLLKKNR